MPGAYGGICMFEGYPASAYGGSTDPAVQQRFCERYPGCAECGGLSAPNPPPGGGGMSAAIVAPAAAARVTAGGGGCGGCGCRGGGEQGGPSVGVFAAAGGAVESLVTIAEQAGPAGIPWWIWVVLALVVLNLLRG